MATETLDALRVETARRTSLPAIAQALRDIGYSDGQRICGDISLTKEGTVHIRFNPVAGMYPFLFSHIKPNYGVREQYPAEAAAWTGVDYFNPIDPFIINDVNRRRDVLAILANGRSKYGFMFKIRNYFPVHEGVPQLALMLEGTVGIENPAEAAKQIDGRVGELLQIIQNPNYGTPVPEGAYPVLGNLRDPVQTVAQLDELLWDTAMTEGLFY